MCERSHTHYEHYSSSIDGLIIDEIGVRRLSSPPPNLLKTKQIKRTDIELRIISSIFKNPSISLKASNPGKSIIKLVDSAIDNFNNK